MLKKFTTSNLDQNPPLCEHSLHCLYCTQYLSIFTQTCSNIEIYMWQQSFHRGGRILFRPWNTISGTLKPITFWLYDKEPFLFKPLFQNALRHLHGKVFASTPRKFTEMDACAFIVIKVKRAWTPLFLNSVCLINQAYKFLSILQPQLSSCTFGPKNHRSTQIQSVTELTLFRHPHTKIHIRVPTIEMRFIIAHSCLLLHQTIVHSHTPIINAQGLREWKKNSSEVRHYPRIQNLVHVPNSPHTWTEQYF